MQDGSKVYGPGPTTEERLSGLDCGKVLESATNSSCAMANSAQQHSYVISNSLRAQIEALNPPTWNRAGYDKLVRKNDYLMREHVLPPLPTEAVTLTAEHPQRAPRFDCTEVCIALSDTLTAALALGEDTCALNFANDRTPGGGYRRGARAQEEDLCRLMPQLYRSLKDSGLYPIHADTALVTPGCEAVRHPGSYKLCDNNSSLGRCTIITAAAPCGVADPSWFGNPKASIGTPWAREMTIRIRAGLNAALHSGHSNVVLGAFGCGAFGNPPVPTAAIFREVLECSEFRGHFERVVFAIIDPGGTGNFKPFQTEILKIDCSQISIGDVSIDAPIAAPAEESNGAEC